MPDIPKPEDAHEAVSNAWPQWSESDYKEAGLTELKNAVIAGNNASISKALNSLSQESFEGVSGTELMTLFDQYHVDLSQQEFNHNSKAGTMLAHAAALQSTKLNLATLNAEYKSEYEAIRAKAATGNYSQAQLQQELDALESKVKSSADQEKQKYDQQHQATGTSLSNPAGGGAGGGLGMGGAGGGQNPMSSLMGPMSQMGQMGAQAAQGLASPLSQAMQKLSGAPSELADKIAQAAKGGGSNTGASGNANITKDSLKSLLSYQKDGKDGGQNGMLDKGTKTGLGDKVSGDSGSSSKGGGLKGGAKGGEPGVHENRGKEGESRTQLGGPDDSSDDTKDDSTGDSKDSPKGSPKDEGEPASKSGENASNPTQIPTSPPESSADNGGKSPLSIQLSSDENSRDQGATLTHTQDIPGAGGGTFTQTAAGVPIAGGVAPAPSVTPIAPSTPMMGGGMPMMGGGSPLGGMFGGGSSPTISDKSKGAAEPIVRRDYQLFKTDDVAFFGSMAGAGNAPTAPVEAVLSSEDKSSQVLTTVVSELAKLGIASPVAVAQISTPTGQKSLVVTSMGLGFMPFRARLPDAVFPGHSSDFPLTSETVAAFAGSTDPAWVIRRLEERGLLREVSGIVSTTVSREIGVGTLSLEQKSHPAAPIEMSLSQRAKEPALVAKHLQAITALTHHLKVNIAPLTDAEISMNMLQWSGDVPDSAYLPAFISYALSNAHAALQEPHLDLGYSSYVLRYVNIAARAISTVTA